MFNDRRHFDRHFREKVLTKLLLNAPRSIVYEILSRMDMDVEINEMHDEEYALLTGLIVSLNADVRCCRSVRFKMKSDWIASRHRGVVNNQELSPEQICDHIEVDMEDNYEELLKIAVNKYLNQNMKFEAAKMLARPAAAHTKVLQSNRNDKQLAYLLSIFQELHPPEDALAPIEEGCLTLPCKRENVLYVDDIGNDLARIERELLGDSAEPIAIGVWWFWRCFDPRLDRWSRASFMAMVYGNTYAIIDFQKLELKKAECECEVKGIVARILSAPHVLKITHNIERYSLGVLQRALVPRTLLIADDAPPYPDMSPVLDLSVVMAACHRTRPDNYQLLNLSPLAFDSFHIELCLAESLSNFEQRPLRLSQLHYALTVAIVPVMILRAFCAYNVLSLQQVITMTLRIGFHGSPEKWDDMLRRKCFGWDGHDNSDGANDCKATYGQNLWEADPEWVQARPKPDPNFDLAHAIGDSVSALVLPADRVAPASAAAATLFDQPFAVRELRALYQAYDAQQSAHSTQGTAR